MGYGLIRSLFRRGSGGIQSVEANIQLVSHLIEELP